MYGCESWTIKKSERRRTDAVELWCWRRLLSLPWTAKEINPEYSLEGLMLKLKVQSFGHLVKRVDSSEKTLMLGKIEGRRRRGRQRMRWLDGSSIWWTWAWVSSRRWWRTGKPGVLQSTGSQSHTRLNDWTTTTHSWKFKKKKKHKYYYWKPSAFLVLSSAPSPWSPLPEKQNLISIISVAALPLPSPPIILIYSWLLGADRGSWRFARITATLQLKVGL